MGSRGWFRNVATVLTLVMILASCGGDDGETSSGIVPSATSAPPTIAAPTLTTEVSATTTPVTPTPSPEVAIASATATATEPSRDLCAEDLASEAGAIRLSSSAAAPGGYHRLDSYILLEGITELTWASRWIVEARIAAECEVSPETGWREYIVEVQRTFRGHPVEYIRMGGIGDRYGPQPPPTAGDQMVLFISDSTDSAGRHWTTGGPQGAWYIRDGVASREGFGPVALPPDELAQAIANVLAVEPLERMNVPAVSLADAPAGPDLPATIQPVAGCGGMLQPVLNPGLGTGGLLWTSQHVFAGTVVEQFPSFRLDEPGVETDPTLRPVVTDYLVRIDQPVRGQPAETVRVRRLGGKVDGCDVRSTGALLEVGSRAFFFAWTPDTTAPDPVNYLNGDVAGFWRFADDETLVVRDGADYRGTAIVPTASFAGGLRSVLEGDMFEDEGFGLPPVPLEDAPLAEASAWPPFEPAQRQAWVTYAYAPFDLQIELPLDWSMAENSEQGVLHLANFPTDGGDWESIPDGGLRIDMRSGGDASAYPRANWFIEEGTPMTVGPLAYPGAILFPSGVTGDTYHGGFIYEAAGSYWSGTAIFKEPVSLDNPNVRIFLAILETISHGT